MKFNKKLFSLLFVALLALVLVGCNGEGTTTEAPGTDAPTTEAPTTEAPTTMPVDFQTALDYLETEYEDTLMNDSFVATEDLTLINSFGEFTFTWSSNNTDILANDGTISRPLLSEGDQTAILTVTVTHGEEEATQDFFVTVKALEEKTPAEIADEVFLFVFAIPSQEFWTSADELNLVAVGEDTDGVEYDVTWATSNADYITTEGVITQPEGDDVDVTLTATITVDDTEFSESRVFTVAKMAEATEVASIAAAIAMGQDAYVEIPGVTVIAMYEGGDVFFTDGTDILYIYSPTFEAVVGEVYDITGLIDFYYNAPQLAGSDTHPLRAADSDAAVTSPTVVDNMSVNDVITATSVPSTENPHEYMTYEVTGSIYYEESWGNYSVFLVPTDYDFDAALASGATQPNGDAIMIYYKSDMDVLESFHGEEITIEIIMQGYRTDKSVFYANFFGTAEDVQLSFSNDADAVEAALGTVDFPYTVVEDTTFDLVTSIYGVTVAYTTDNDTVFDTTTGAIDVSTLTAQTTIAVTATATKGTESDSATFSIKVGPLPTSDISDVLDLPDSDLAMIEGTIVAGGYHGLFFIQDGTDNIALYLDAYGDDYDTWMSTLEANVGNVMKVTGEKDTYNGLHQLRVSEFEYVSDATAPTPTNIDGMTLDEAGLLAHQGELVELTGMVITDVYEDNYGNYQFTLERISDGEEIKLRWDSRYDLPTALMTEVESLAVGDKVTVTTVLSWFRGPQLALVTTTDFTVTTLTDADKVALDVRYMESELTLSEDYVLTDGDFGSTISVVEIFGNAANFMDTTTTAGTWAITQPYGTDVMAMVTFTVMSGTVEEMVEVEVTIPGASLASSTSDLIISEYGEGSGQNKWIEIYNGTGADVDLTDYTIEYYNNGATAVTQTYDLTGTLADGEVLVLTTTDADAAIQAEADESFAYPAVVYFNGNDDVALVKDGTIIDLVGEIGSDADFAKDVTLVRNPSILTPNATFTIGEWTSHATDTFTFVGSHTVDTVTMTDEVTVNADLAALDLGGVIKAAQAVALPTTGTYGSTITWTIAEDTDSNATMNATNDEVTFTDAPADTVEVVKLEATVTMNAETMTGMFVYKVEGVTDADRVAADKAEVEALNLGGDAYAEVSVSLPQTGTNGSTITWAITTDADALAAYTAPDLTIDRAEGTDSIVVLTATITKGTESDTVVVTYNMQAEITDLSMLYAMTDGTNYDIPEGTKVYVKGIVIADIYDGFFIQDENGNGILIDDMDATVGDEVIYSGTLAMDYGVRELQSGMEISVISNGNDLVYTVMTADEIVALDASDTGRLITYTGLEVASYSSGYPYSITFDVEGTTETIQLTQRFYSNYADWLDEAFVVGDVLPEVSFIFFNFRDGDNQVEAIDIEFTDELKLQADVNKLPETLTLTDNYVLPTPAYGTYSVTVSSELDAYIDETTTPGTLLVTRPQAGNTDVTGTVTVQVSYGTETPVDVTINITILANYDYSSETTYTESFDNYPETGSSYVSGSFTGENGVTWTYTDARGDQDVDGSAAVTLRNNSTANLTSSTISGGIGKLTIQYYNAFSTVAGVEVYINGNYVGESSEVGDKTVTTFEIEILIEGDFTVTFMTTDGQLVLDNLTWTTYTPAT